MNKRISSDHNNFDFRTLEKYGRISEKSQEYKLDPETRFLIKKKVLHDRDVEFLKAFIEEMLIESNIDTQHSFVSELVEALTYLEGEEVKTIEGLNSTLKDGHVKNLINSLLEKESIINHSISDSNKDLFVPMVEITDTENLTDENVKSLIKFMRPLL